MDRDQFLATTILASFAMLYVNSSFLPKTDFLTGIDKVTKWGLGLQFITGIGCSLMVAWLDARPGDAPLVHAINRAASERRADSRSAGLRGQLPFAQALARWPECSKNVLRMF